MEINSSVPSETLEPSAPSAPSADDQSFRFPYEIMNGPAGLFAKTYGEILEAPKEFFYISFLTVLGSVLSRKVTIATEIKPQPRLYTLLLGESADDRKSTAIKKTCEFWRYVMDYLFKQSLSECWGVGSAEGLATHINKRASNGIVLLCYDEFKSFISKANIKSSILLPCVNTLFEENRYENAIKNQYVLLKDAHLSILAASTMETYEASWQRSFTDIGFNNRLFLVPGSGIRRESLPPKIPEPVMENMAREVDKIFRFVGPYREIGLSEAAKSMWHEWYMTRPRTIHGKRLDGYGLRLMLLMAVNNMVEIIDVDIVSDAIELIDWQHTVREIHDPIDAENQYARMEQKIRTLLKLKGPLSDRDLKNFSNARRTGLMIFTSAIQNLRREKEIMLRRDRKWILLKID